jgi:DNA end-binding protein Ku
LVPRAIWKGFLKVAEVSFRVALYTAVSTSDRIAFHTVNRATGHRVHREFVDSETGKPVAKEDQVKGYEVGKGDYVALDPEEVSSAVPDSDKTLSVFAFIRCDDIDDIYFDRPYYLAAAEKPAEEGAALIREGMRRNKVVAIARAVLFRRVRTLLIRAHGDGFIATTLNFDYEVRSAKASFEHVPSIAIKGEMLELAQHIIKTKQGKFDPSQFEDRYEKALAGLVKASWRVSPSRRRNARSPPRLSTSWRRCARARACAPQRALRKRNPGRRRLPGRAARPRTRPPRAARRADA